MHTNFGGCGISVFRSVILLLFKRERGGMDEEREEEERERHLHSFLL